MCSLQTTRN